MECRWYGLRWLLKGIGKKIRSAVVVFTHDLLICVSSPTHRHTHSPLAIENPGGYATHTQPKIK